MLLLLLLYHVWTLNDYNILFRIKYTPTTNNLHSKKEPPCLFIQFDRKQFSLFISMNVTLYRNIKKTYFVSMLCRVAVFPSQFFGAY